MLNKVRKAIGGGFEGVKTLAVAVSGGADSVALLNAMLALKGEYGIEVFAAHFNHKLRGSESERDESFVKSLCEKYGIGLVTGEGNVAAFAKEKRVSTELAARQMRYDFFEGLNADLVATAHTASDNLETVIFNLIRGSGIEGLCGIPVTRDRYIRPLIFCTRCEIEEYCRENGLSYITDSTNLSDDYTRNRIRHKIVPLLKEINPAVEENTCNTALLLSGDRDLLNEIANAEYQKMIRKSGLNVSGIKDLSPAAARRVLRIFCKAQTGQSPDFSHTEDLLAVALSGGKCSLPGNAEAYRQKDILKIKNRDFKTVFNVKIEKVELSLIKKSEKVNNLLLNNLIDCDKIVGEISVRTRREGDKIRLKGRGCTKTLKQLYNEKSVSQGDRENLPVIADDEGVLWIAGIGVAERAAVSQNSESVYKITYETVYGGNNKQ